MTTPQTHYHTLGLTPSATPEEIKTAYRHLARQHHPDLHQDPVIKLQAEARFKTINGAYAILRDPEARRHYDRSHGTASPQPSQHPTASGSRQSTQETDDHHRASRFAAQSKLLQSLLQIRRTIRLSLRELLIGTQRQLTLTRLTKCTRCHGSGALDEGRLVFLQCTPCQAQGSLTQVRNGRTRTMLCPTCTGRGLRVTPSCHQCQGTGRESTRTTLTLTIPKWSLPDDILTFQQKGHYMSTEFHGDLHIKLAAKDHRLCTIHGEDLHFPLRLSQRRATQGGIVTTKTATETIKLQLPPGLTAGMRLRITGHGLPRRPPGTPRARALTRGDAVYTVIIR